MSYSSYFSLAFLSVARVFASNYHPPRQIAAKLVLHSAPTLP